MWWRELGYDGRKRRLRAWRSLIAARMDEFADLIHRENGKPIFDAIGELSIAIEHLDWAAGSADKVLGRRKVGSGLLAMNHAASVEYLPYGVVGVLGPWNYPVHTPMGSISYALAAGNAVVFKPSEFTPAIGAWLVDSFAEVVPEQPVFQLITGFGETGNALCTAGVDKLAFTGSTATGKKVMAACAADPHPGRHRVRRQGRADRRRGCRPRRGRRSDRVGRPVQRRPDLRGRRAGVRRRDPSTTSSSRRSPPRRKHVRGGSDATANYGPITMPSQLDVIRAHIAGRAGRSGGRAVVGGPESVQATVRPARGPRGRPGDSSARYGRRRSAPRSPSQRSATRTRRSRGPTTASTASALRCSAPSTAARSPTSCPAAASASTPRSPIAMVPELPFGGVRDSGFGRIHGADGLREFAWPRSVTSRALPALR